MLNWLQNSASVVPMNPEQIRDRAEHLRARDARYVSTSVPMQHCRSIIELGNLGDTAATAVA